MGHARGLTFAQNDHSQPNDTFHRRYSPTSFYPMITKGPSDERVDRMARQIPSPRLCRGRSPHNPGFQAVALVRMDRAHTRGQPGTMTIWKPDYGGGPTAARIASPV